VYWGGGGGDQLDGERTITLKSDDAVKGADGGKKESPKKPRSIKEEIRIKRLFTSSGPRILGFTVHHHQVKKKSETEQTQEKKSPLKLWTGNCPEKWFERNMGDGKGGSDRCCKQLPDNSESLLQEKGGKRE